MSIIDLICVRLIFYVHVVVYDMWRDPGLARPRNTTFYKFKNRQTFSHYQGGSFAWIFNIKMYVNNNLICGNLWHRPLMTRIFSKICTKIKNSLKNIDIIILIYSNYYEINIKCHTSITNFEKFIHEKSKHLFTRTHKWKW